MGHGAAFRGSRRTSYRSQGRTMRRGTEGCSEAPSMQVIWPRVYARTSGRRAHGVVGRIMRSLLQLRTPEGSSGKRPESDGVNLNPVEEAAPARIRFRDPQIEMAHGAGGKASRRLVDGFFAPLLFGPSAEPLG